MRGRAELPRNALRIPLESVQERGLSPRPSVAQLGPCPSSLFLDFWAEQLPNDDKTCERGRGNSSAAKEHNEAFLSPTHFEKRHVDVIEDKKVKDMTCHEAQIAASTQVDFMRNVDIAQPFCETLGHS